MSDNMLMKKEPIEDNNHDNLQTTTNVVISSSGETVTIPQQVPPIANITDLIGLVASQLQNKNVSNPLVSLPLNINLSGNSIFSTIEGLMSLAPAITNNDETTPILTSLPLSPVGSITSSISSPGPVDGGESSSLMGAGAFAGGADSQHLGGGKIKRKSGPRYAEAALAREDKLVCGVCGDRALGCNFDAISCESCKAFFRRNALKDKKTKCLFEGSCKIDVNTRRFCPFCRLKKCFEIGMKKEFILGDDEKKKRLAKVMQNKEKKGKDDDGAVDSFPDSPMPPPPSTPTPTTHVTSVSPTIPLQNAGGGATVTNVSPIQFNTPIQHPTIQVTLEIPSGSTESVNLLSLSRFVKTNDTFNVPMDSYLVRRLTTEESSMLQEVMQVYDLSFTVDIEPLIHIQQEYPSLNQLVNQSSVTVLRIIKFAKRIEEFVRLPQECQIGILKGCWINILLLRSVSVYDSDRDTWLTPRGEIPTNILKNATGFVRLHDDHVNYCKSIRSIIKDDLTIVVLLIVIVLFAPEGPHVVTRELVSNIQDKYLVLLKHYLESKYMYARAAEMFPQLMSKMKELKELAEDHGKYLLDVNPSEIEPIMLEILDLK